MPIRRRSLMVGAALLMPAIARAQSFPTLPLRLIPPYPPGGGTDTVARLLVPHMIAQLGQNIVVENRGGAGGSIGAAEVARAPKDGHTMLLDSMGHVVNPTLMRGLPFDYATAFAPITQLTWQPQMLVVPANSPYRTAAALIAAAKARPGTVSYASSGNGTGAHLAMVEFTRLASVEMTHIPYRGGGPAMTDLVAGNVTCAFASAAAATAHVQGGRLRGLGAAGLRRIGSLPDMATLDEQGYRGFDFDEWNGLWTVGGSPPAAVARLHGAAIFALNQPDVKARMAQIGIVPLGSSPEEFAAFVTAQRDRAARLIRAANITLG
jgi:tripartite-type tricarboxylate transporter receptor subunit TctC